ncbi:hypothetical protein FDECE_17249 [Fusarium decemcellulare]|nr:hypothetical protein FDECE_17249 [Fusarium decemcellulare]
MTRRQEEGDERRKKRQKDREVNTDISDADDSDNPESRRKRIRQACLNCRRKKVRCGGEKPVCNFCSRLSQTCLYAEDGRSHRRTSMPYQPGSDDVPDAVMVREDILFGALDADVSRLIPLASFNAANHHTPSHLLDLHAQNHDKIPTPITTVSQAQTATQSPEKDRPQMHTLLFAADVYFRFCHNQPYSLFHEQTFRRRLVDGTLPPYLLWALLSVARRYSTLPAFQLATADDALVYATRAWECIDLPWNGGTSPEDIIPVIQAIILIVNTEHPAGLCGQAYMKLGFAIRIALHSKLHLEPETDMPIILREERKRTFWSLYLQDKLISLSRGRFCVLRDEECRISLPCSEEAFKEGREEQTPVLADFTNDCMEQEAADGCCPLALITVMASTLGRVSHYVLHDNRYSQLGLPWSSASPYATISSTLLQVEHYFGMNEDPKESLERRCFTDGAVDQHLAGSFIYSKALFHLSHCLLHHPFLIQQRLEKLKQKTPPIFMKAAWEKCRAHAKSLTDLKDMKNHNVLILTSIYGYCTMVAGTIHVLSMNDEKESVREEGLEHYNAALEFLRELSCYWGHAALMVNRLERFRLQCENRRRELNPCTPSTNHSPGDVKALWQSVDHVLLSTPTRPGSPTLEGGMSDMEWFSSPSQLFDFADFTGFAEGVDALGPLQFLGGDMAIEAETM